jgi:hypothetical protein
MKKADPWAEFVRGRQALRESQEKEFDDTTRRSLFSIAVARIHDHEQSAGLSSGLRHDPILRRLTKTPLQGWLSVHGPFDRRETVTRDYSALLLTRGCA